MFTKGIRYMLLRDMYQEGLSEELRRASGTGSMKGFFIDTNVIAQYLILEKFFKNKKGKLADRYMSSHKLMKKIISCNKKDCKFVISRLVVAEMYYALFDEHRCESMLDDGVPLSCWIDNKWKVRISKEKREEIIKLVLKFSYDYVYSEEDKTTKKILSVADIADEDIISDLVFNYNVRTHDAVLISTAINNQCNYLITTDTRLKDDHLKNYKKIKLISPTHAIEKIG